MSRRQLPDSVALAVARQHPHLAPLVGKVSPVAVQSDTAKPKKPAKVKPRFGNIICDSQTEADLALSLSLKHPAVLVHGCLHLADDCHIQPDFVIVERINPDGSFVGRLADAKACWGKSKAAHVEPDWKVKQKWAEEKYGLKINIITKERTE